MDPAITQLLTVLVGGLIGVAGALGSQRLTARTNVRLKRLELVYTRRLEAYKALLEGIQEVIKGTRDFDDHYLRQLPSLLVVSPKVHRAIAGKGGVIVCLGQLEVARLLKDNDAIAKATMDANYAALFLTTTMRADLIAIAEIDEQQEIRALMDDTSPKFEELKQPPKIERPKPRPQS